MYFVRVFEGYVKEPWVRKWESSRDELAFTKVGAYHHAKRFLKRNQKTSITILIQKMIDNRYSISGPDYKTVDVIYGEELKHIG